VWEGIDTQQEDGRNRLVKLALHILSVVANSAGCERAFSHMGLIHTAIRSKLSVDKVRKTTIVGMDIKQSHMDAGLVCPHVRRNFEAPTSEHETSLELTTEATDSIEDVADFDQLAEQLIGDSIDDFCNTANDNPPTPPLTIWLPLHAIQAALPDTTPVSKTAIPLMTLFIFPNENTPPGSMEYFWQGGVANLTKEMEAYDLLWSGQESNIDTESSTTGSTSA
jgi:hypothetical protein